MKRSPHTGFSSGLRVAALLSRHSRLLAGLVILASVAVLLYPWASNYVFEHQADSIISTYEKDLSEQSTPELEAMLEQAQSYNAALNVGRVQLVDPFKPTGLTGISEDYASLLSTSDTLNDALAGLLSNNTEGKDKGSDLHKKYCVAGQYMIQLHKSACVV